MKTNRMIALTVIAILVLTQVSYASWWKLPKSVKKLIEIEKLNKDKSAAPLPQDLVNFLIADYPNIPFDKLRVIWDAELPEEYREVKSYSVRDKKFITYSVRIISKRIGSDIYIAYPTPRDSKWNEWEDEEMGCKAIDTLIMELVSFVQYHKSVISRVSPPDHEGCSLENATASKEKVADEKTSTQ